MNYLTSFGMRSTSQGEPIPGSGQVENSAGGFAWAVDEWTRLRRFLILGSEGGSYYAGERELTRENAEVVVKCVGLDGERTVREVVEVSAGGRAPKNAPAVFALAVCASLGDDATRRAAFGALPEVCRIGTHLFHFARYVEQFRGWGRGLRKAVAGWYQRDVDQVAYQAVKYRQRDGWSHRDLLRLAHPKAPSPEHDALYGWIVGQVRDGVPRLVDGYARACLAGTARESARLVREFGLPREAVQADHLASVEVWDALLENMPMTALVRNLATLTRVGLLKQNSDGERKVLDQLADAERLRNARVHPIAVLAALRTYAAGRGARGQNEWQPNVRVVDALDAAFYTAFENVEPTNKRYMLALDVSGSMEWGEIAGTPGLTPRVASAAMALVTAATERSYTAVAFTSGPGLLGGLSLSPRQRLDDVIGMVSRLPFGGTDCALPMLAAKHDNIDVDVFVVYTDSETWAGRTHPAQALREYREHSGIDAKLVVCGMVSNGFSIADPNDTGMLDVVGFDTSTPQLMAEFTRGI